MSGSSPVSSAGSGRATGTSRMPEDCAREPEAELDAVLSGKFAAEGGKEGVKF